MADGSIRAGIQLESYKLSKISFEVTQDMLVLAQKEHSDCEARYQFGFRDAVRFKAEEKICYVTGVKIELTLFDKSIEQDIASGEFIITGLFSASGELDKDTEESLIKRQGPAILFPYIRSAISLVLTSAGFSSIILPLINVHAATSPMDLKIKDIEPVKKS